MTILVTGARGHVGWSVLDQLVAAGVKVRASSRTHDTAGLPPTVSIVVADLTRPKTLPAVLAGVSKVFLYAQPDGIDGFVRAATTARVEPVVFLSSSSTVTGPSASDPIAQRRRAVKHALANSEMA